MNVIMDIEKSRKFYQDRYHKALKQYGANSLTASICRKKLELLGTELLGTKVKQDTNDNAESIVEPLYLNPEKT